MSKIARIGPVLVLAAVAGLLLGTMGPKVTRALAATTTSADTTTTDTTTAETTTTPETVTETQTTVTTVTATTRTQPTTATTEPASSSSSTPWGWIALGLALAALAVIAFAIWQRRRVGAAESWSAETADLNRRSLLVLDDVLSQGSVVTGRVQALAGEAGALEARAPDDQARAEAGRLRARLDELASTLESDRALRLSSPPPSQEQISYSDSLIRQQAEQLQGVLRPPRPGPPPQ